MSERRAARAVGRPGDLVLDLAAVLGALCIVAVGGATAFGLRPLVVAGSSMEPSIPLGSLALVRSTPVEQLVPGDVVSVVRGDGSRVTHRLVAVGAVPGSPGVAELTLRGDANSGPDAVRPVQADAERVVATVPGLGGPIRQVDGPWAMFVLGALAGAGCWLTGRRSPRRVRAVLWVDDVAYRVQA